MNSPFVEAIRRHSEKNPNKLAIIAADKEVSYGDLYNYIKGAAMYLKNNGISKGDIILLAAQKELDFVYLYFAAQLTGVISVIADPQSSESRLKYIAKATCPKLCFGIEIPSFRNNCQPYPDIPKYDKELESTAPEISEISEILFTTGTTGAPKGVCLSYRNIFASASNINGYIKNREDDVEILGLPLSHSFGLGRLRCNVLTGATLVVIGNFANLHQFFSAIERYHVTGFGMVPAVWAYIKKFSGQRIAKYSCQLKYIEIGSAAMSEGDKRLLSEMFPKTRICMHYGLTEASRAFFMEFHTYADNISSIGKPSSPTIRAKILDDYGKEVPCGTPGEICISGEIIMKTYLSKNDNKQAFFEDFFRTGDWGYEDKNGDFYLSGRKKELINIGGEKINPAEIEEAIKKLGVEDCACVAVPDPEGILGEVPKAYILRAGCSLSLEEIRQKTSSVLDAHLIPRYYEWVEEIPRTSSGKIQRLLLKD